jgi:hypothetical protein
MILLLEIILWLGSLGCAFWLGMIYQKGTRKVRWGVWKMVCRICSHKFVMVAPENIDDVDNCECPNCGNMSAEPETTDDEGAE